MILYNFLAGLFTFSASYQLRSSSFVDVTPHCPLLLCLVGDQSSDNAPRHRCSTSFTTAVIVASVAPPPPCQRHCPSPASWCSPASWTVSLLVILPVPLSLPRRHDRSPGRTPGLLELLSATSAAGLLVRELLSRFSLLAAAPGIVVCTPIATSRYHEPELVALEPRCSFSLLAPSMSVDDSGWSIAATSHQTRLLLLTGDLSTSKPDKENIGDYL
ncbi:hypothetical protein Syun_017511 [Stephania yunnanensis]|uniref:Uncharacterized protein n=1 Tax=Stephania yunnanensis TaxID=152371 RepID=A0AAP0J720_9MAGN